MAIRFENTAGENSRTSKLTGAQVEAIRRRRRQGEDAKRLAQEFGVSKDYVYQLARRNRWKSLA